MFDFRYHIVSLVAVFLALGIGILVGTMVVERGVLTEQERALIEKLEEDFGKLRAENQKLTGETQADQRFQQAVLPYLVAGHLNQKKVAVVVTTALDNSVEKRLGETIQQAGGKLVSTTTLRGELGLNGKENMDKIAQAIGASGSPTKELKGKLLTEIARAVATAQNPKLVTELGNLGVLKAEGSYDAAVDAVVVVGGVPDGATTAAEATDVPLLKALLSHNIAVVGCEISTSKGSYMRDYQRAGVPTVDNIDSLIGQIAVVYVLEGQAGNYGVKATAQQILPPLSPR